MIMKETYLETLKDAVLNTQDSYFKNKKKEEILADESLLDKAAYDFQKNHEEFGCDYDWSLNEALSEILKIEVPGHNICISPELDRDVHKPKIVFVVVTYYSFDMDMPMKKCDTHEDAVKYIESSVKNEVRILEDEEGKIKGTDFVVETDCSGAWARIRNLKDGTYIEWNIGTLEV